MSCVFGRELFPHKHVPQVPSTASTYDFGTITIDIRLFFYTPWNFLIKAWPTATRMKFCIRYIERVITLTTHIRAFDEKIIICTASWDLGFFVNKDIRLFGGQMIVCHISSIPAQKA